MSSDYFLVRKGATALRNDVIFSDLSWSALGILAYALSLPDRAPRGYRAFLGRGMGEKAVRNALSELTELGYRHQFRIRSQEGTLRTATVFADVPLSEVEARTAVVIPAGWTVSADRAAPAAARSDQQKQDTAPRPTVPCSTVARSATALPRRGNKDSSLRSESLPNQTAVADDDGVAGSGEGDSPKEEHVDAALAPADAALIASCLPNGMQALPSGKLPEIARQLRIRREAGWTSRQIRGVLDTPLPPEVKNLAALVLYRLKESVVPTLAPAALRRSAAPAAPRPDPGAEPALDPDAEREWNELQRAHPEMSAAQLACFRVRQARHAQEHPSTPPAA